MTDRTPRIIASILMAMIAAATAAGAVASKVDGLLGQWGGDRLVLTMNQSGGVLRSDCADGRITGPVTPDGKGGFKANGRFDLLRPGAQIVDEGPGDGVADTSRFNADITGEQMHLTIMTPGAPPRHFTLTKGKAVKLVRCL